MSRRDDDNRVELDQHEADDELSRDDEREEGGEDEGRGGEPGEGQVGEQDGEQDGEKSKRRGERGKGRGPSAAPERRGERRRDDDWHVRRSREVEPATTIPTRPGTMVVNDTPGEECRVGILRDGLLEQLFMERSTTTTQVGNIYKGRVTNVEPAIQAAFIDYGQGQAGFLHISDLHPKYFPSGDKTERVGKKIPRRDRPLMQEALRRGDEVIVQVLKQGLGTKGPTLTSYLSIAGRLLVMMPWMDKSGVSRKVEDEDQRREMREILDSLELPDGFGFILRTAGFDRTKPELQRDAAYLLRLWDVMDRRMRSVGAPCALYTESDLLIRTIRDVVDSSIESIVVDSDSAFTRAKAFLDVVAPRSAPPVRFYDRPVPIFHAFDIERQIDLTHSRIVPLKSGGALVIDQTEALVAIDVNSGKSRAARDSETNAYHTNIEAVEEIARQLRLRDLGGVVICDLIDMRSQRHRREIEERFRDQLRRDRARTTTAPISDFGILELTRQRMRPSLRKTHYIDCPHCDGHGEIKMPDAVAGDALRQIAHLLHYERVKRVEMACSTRVASILLSGRRRSIDEIEDRSGKKVEIRISEALALDRVDLYAYDDRGADIDITKLPVVKPPKPSELHSELPEGVRSSPAAELDEEEENGGGRRGGRRRRRKPAPADATTIALEGGFEEFPDEEDEADRVPAAVAAAAARSEDRSGGEPKDDARVGGREERGRRGRGRGRRDDDRRGAEEGQPPRGAGGETERRTPATPAVATPFAAGPAAARGARPAAAATTPNGGPNGASSGASSGGSSGSLGGNAATGSERDEEGDGGGRRRRRRRRKGGLRLGELAAQIGVPAKEVVLRARSQRIFNLQDELSRVAPDLAAIIREWYGVAAPAPGEDGHDEGGDDGYEDGQDDRPSDGQNVDRARDVAHERENERFPAPPVQPPAPRAGPVFAVAAAVPLEEASDGVKPRRLHELAKELGVPSRDLIARCAAASLTEMKNHMSVVSPEVDATVRSWYPSHETPAPPAPPVPTFERRAPYSAPEPRRSEPREPVLADRQPEEAPRRAAPKPTAVPPAVPAAPPAPVRSVPSPAPRPAARPAPAQPAHATPPAALAPAAAPKKVFRPLYSAGRSRKIAPTVRSEAERRGPDA